jgi:hypothetical protein
MSGPGNITAIIRRASFRIQAALIPVGIATMGEFSYPTEGPAAALSVATSTRTDWDERHHSFTTREQDAA